MKYAVITSQYMSSCVSAAVVCEHDFQSRMKQALKKLEIYKRDLKDREPHYGDFDDQYYNSEKKHYVVNDSGGDFYVTLTDTVSGAIRIAAKEQEDTQKFWGNPNASTCEKIAAHHAETKILAILSHYFVLA